MVVLVAAVVTVVAVVVDFGARLCHHPVVGCYILEGLSLATDIHTPDPNGLGCCRTGGGGSNSNGIVIFIRIWANGET